MMPIVEEVCIKDIVTIGINHTMKEAINKMFRENVRSIVILADNGNDFYMLTASDVIEYKIDNIALTTKLSDLPLEKAQKIDAKVSVLEIINNSNLTHEYMIVVFENKIMGILSQTDIINNIDPQLLIERQSLGSLISKYTAITIFKDESTATAIRIMKSKHVDSILVVDDKQRPLGIFTTKDFLNIMQNDDNLNLSIHNFMSSPLKTVPYNIKVYEALQFIKKEHFKRIVLTENDGRVSGVITQSELLRLLNNKWLELIKERGAELSKINKKLLEKTAVLEQKASTDFLTKLYNRRKFDSLIEYEIEQIRRYHDRDLCVILLDIDNFKHINDTYGHDIGDIILQDIAKILKSSCRNSDICCRWGGEEFAISLSHTKIEDCLLVAEKIRVTIQNHIFVKKIHVTCSFGISQLHSTESYPNLFKRADKALYYAKNSGKNKVELERI